MRLYFVKGPFNIADIIFELGGTSPPTTVDVTGVSVNPTKLTLDEGDTAAINASVAPSDATETAVIWSSSNRGVATVDNSGTVTAASKGFTKITATTVDGGYKASIGVTVNSTNFGGGNEGGGTDGGTAPCNNLTRVSLPFSHYGAGSYCWEISGTINFINSWSTESITINEIDYTNIWSNSMPEPIDGKYYVQYEANLGWSHFEVDGVTAKLETGTEGKFKIYPNPSNGNFQIENQTFSEQAVVEIYNNYGQTVYRQEGIPSNGNLNISTLLQSGLYLVTVIDDQLSTTKKLVIK